MENEYALLAPSGEIRPQLRSMDPLMEKRAPVPISAKMRQSRSAGSHQGYGRKDEWGRRERERHGYRPRGLGSPPSVVAHTAHASLISHEFANRR